MKGFYISEVLIALLLMGVVLTAVSSVVFDLNAGVKSQHYRMLATEINVSVKRALAAGVPLASLKQFIQEHLPNATLSISNGHVVTCWQVAIRACEAL